MADQQRLPAAFYRGGTSKAVIFKAADLPDDRATWPEIFAAVMGSPDQNGRQLDGMGGGLSSLSKICVVGPSSRPDADVDYTFAQIGITDRTVDFGGNCGNMSSAIGPFAVDEGLVIIPTKEANATVRVHNTNTGQVIEAHFPVRDGRAVVQGDTALAGVAGTAAAIELRFMNPVGAGTGRLFPTGARQEQLALGPDHALAATLIDGANPLAIISAADVGLDCTVMPEAIANDVEAMAFARAIRKRAAVAMGLAKDEAAAETIVMPQIAFVAPMQETAIRDGTRLTANDGDLLVRAISAGQPHRAVPLTCAMTLAVAMRIPGTIAHAITGGSSADNGSPTRVRIAHSSGVAEIAVSVDADTETATVKYAAVTRTARRLFDGHVYWRG